MPDLATIRDDPNFVNANAATKKAIFDKWAPQDPNYADANPATQAAIRQRFGIEAPAKAQPKQDGVSLKGFGRNTASFLDSTVGSILPGAVNWLSYAERRAMGADPKAASAAAARDAAPLENPVGRIFGVTDTPEYKGENIRRFSEFIGKNIGKGAKWLSDKTGVPEQDIVSYLGTLSFAAPEIAGAAGRGAMRGAAPIANSIAAQTGRAAEVARNAMRPREGAPALKGGGAMDASASMLRQTTAQGLRRPVQLTKGQITRDPAQLRFENETRKSNADTVGQPLVQRQIEQNEDILANFDAYLSATGAERAGEGQLRPVGLVVDKALVDAAKARKKEVSDAYAKAREAGEMEEPVSYKPLIDFVNEQTPTTREKLAPIIQAVAEQIGKNDPENTGSISINAMEDIRQLINKTTQPGTPNAAFAPELKKLIDSTTEGATGQLYREARSRRIQYAKEFENAGAVEKLLRRKPGTKDRSVALEDVFDHVILDGSLDDTMNVGRLLKKTGEPGQQAWKELQGQTIQYIRDQVTKSPATDPAGNPFPSPAKFNAIVRDLDSSGKLDYIFGKKGAQEIRDLNATVQAAYTAPPGTINYSNTAGVVVDALQKLEKSILGQIPGVKGTARYAAEKARDRKLRQQVEEALYPGADDQDPIAAKPIVKRPTMRRNRMAPANQNSMSRRKGN
ncbi:hypothetical protein [Rhizorhabdus histidinilytica]|uniref:Large polyvalent protein associated domain-containing protein n=1 Tax=Rhizorhabdus histidinilytica TaxID=439228 RepID=A0A1T5A7H4_9SPHN|nr:hypothetical protein [Rhizorhabdus histidinilytica]SKB30809.1 hypothetical protein SAMN06295920_101662 [Rhizorhabdus histidinilytica]